MSNIQSLPAEPSAHVTSAIEAGTGVLGFIAQLPENIIKVVNDWQDYGKNPQSSNADKVTSFRDIGPSRGDGLTDYAKPIWRR